MSEIIITDSGKPVDILIVVVVANKIPYNTYSNVILSNFSNK